MTKYQHLSQIQVLPNAVSLLFCHMHKIGKLFTALLHTHLHKIVHVVIVRHICILSLFFSLMN